MKGKENETQCEAAHGPLQPGQRAADSAGRGGGAGTAAAWRGYSGQAGRDTGWK